MSNKQTRLDERQYMEMARTLATREVPILRGIIEDSTAALFNCHYDEFLSNAEQALSMRPRAEVAYCIEHALAPYRKAAKVQRRAA